MLQNCSSMFLRIYFRILLIPHYINIRTIERFTEISSSNAQRKPSFYLRNIQQIVNGRTKIIIIIFINSKTSCKFSLSSFSRFKNFSIWNSLLLCSLKFKQKLFHKTIYYEKIYNVVVILLV